MSREPAIEPLRTVPAGAIEPPESTERWLIRSLWPASAVGIIGGPPKAAKTWLGLDIALSVASATDCLGQFPVEQPGTVLGYLAEDSLVRTHARLIGMASRRSVQLPNVPLHLISEPVVRLDRTEHLERLVCTIEQLAPRLLLLDPLVRLHRVNENDAGEVSRVLASLRELQRAHDLAIVLVHHARKGGRPSGDSLRGSGDLYAWGDTYAYMQRAGDTLRLVLEHRDERPIEPLELRLESYPDGTGTHLVPVEPGARPDLELERRLVELLRSASVPMTRGAIRDSLKVNNKRLGDALAKLEEAQQLVRTSDGWSGCTA